MILVLLITGGALARAVLGCVAIDSPTPLETRLRPWSGFRSQVSMPSSGGNE
jgi:hypothetical protein